MMVACFVVPPLLSKFNKCKDNDTQWNYRSAEQTGITRCSVRRSAPAECQYESDVTAMLQYLPHSWDHCDLGHALFQGLRVRPAGNERFATRHSLVQAVPS